MTIFDFLVIFIQGIWAVSEFVIYRKMRSSAGNADRRSYKYLYWIAIASLIIGISVGNLAKFNLLRGFYHPEAIYPILGICLMILGMIIRGTAIHQLRHFFTINVAIQQDHRLITDGWYRILRHPAYLGGILTFIGCGISYGNLISGLVIPVPYILLILNRIEVEEAVLEGEFGDEYRDMKRRTKKMIPFLY
jgi:protein-S-isoprenylcysteine O-methyltransferase Ste14